jgi:hypothetical protein
MVSTMSDQPKEPLVLSSRVLVLPPNCRDVTAETDGARRQARSDPPDAAGSDAAPPPHSTSTFFAQS